MPAPTSTHCTQSACSAAQRSTIGRGLLIALTFTSSMISPGLCDEPQQTPDQLEQIKLKSVVWGNEDRQATALIKARKYSEAEAIYKKIVADRQSLLLYQSSEIYLLAQLYLVWGKKDEAEKVYKDIIMQQEKVNGPEAIQLVSALNEYADCLVKLGRGDEAVKLRTRAKKIERDYNSLPKFGKITAAPGSPERAAEAAKMRTTGEALVKNDNQTKALAYFNRAIALEPNDAETLCDRANALSFAEQNSKAMLDVNQAIKLKPNMAKPYVTRAYLYENLSKEDLAIADFKKAVSLDGKDVSTLGDLAKILDNKDKHKEAVDYYSRVVAIQPDLYWPYVQRGLAYSSMGEHKLALADYDLLVKRAPEDSDFYEWRGAALIKAGEMQKALADYNKLISLKPNYATGYHGRALVYEKLDGKKSPRVMADNAAAKKYGYE